MAKILGLEGTGTGPKYEEKILCKGSDISVYFKNMFLDLKTHNPVIVEKNVDVSQFINENYDIHVKGYGNYYILTKVTEGDNTIYGRKKKIKELSMKKAGKLEKKLTKIEEKLREEEEKKKKREQQQA